MLKEKPITYAGVQFAPLRQAEKRYDGGKYSVDSKAA
jgi:hypothetical protein|tara:strand:+ start:3845 stop:3955 length:111 start_codon:yes stop_codon:yes gene_type:complete